jgi:hypothetical protein
MTSTNARGWEFVAVVTDYAIFKRPRSEPRALIGADVSPPTTPNSVAELSFAEVELESMPNWHPAELPA